MPTSRTRPATWIGALLLGAGSIAGALPPARDAQPVVMVVLSREVPAYQEALHGLEKALLAGGYSARVADAQDRGLPQRIASAAPRLIITLGSRALEAVSALEPPAPVLSSLVLDGDSQPAARLLATVSLELPPAAVLARLRNLYPQRKRLAVVRNPERGAAQRAELLAAAQKLGYTLEIVDCASPKELLEAAASLRGRADFLWCLPDRALYHPATVQPLILASLRNKVPLIGFSESFVKAGALVGFFPDYRDIGAQTGELASHYLSGQAVARREVPRAVAAALNERVSRLLGLELPTASAAEGVVVVK